MFIRGAMASGVSVVLVGVLNYLTRRVIAVELEPGAFGFFYAVLATTLLCAWMADCGFSGAIAIILPRWLQAGKVAAARACFSSAMLIWLCLGLAFGLFLYAGAPQVATRLHLASGTGVVRTLALTLPFIIVFSGFLEGLRAVANFSARGWFQVTQVFVLLGILLSGALARGGAAAAAWAAFASYAIATVAICLYAGWRHPELRWICTFSSRLIGRLWHLGRWYFVAAGGFALYNTADVQILTAVAGLDAGALYNIALPVQQIFLAVLTVGPTVFTPVAARLWQAGTHEALQSLYGLLWDGMLLVCGVALLCTVACGDLLITVLFSARYAAAHWALTILVASLFFLILSMLHLSLLGVIHQARSIGLVMLATIITLLPGTVAGSWLWGATGAAAAKLIATIVMFLVSYRALPASVRNGQLSSKRTLRLMAILVAECAGLIVVRIVWPGFGGLLGQVVAALLACGVFAMANGALCKMLLREIPSQLGWRKSAPATQGP